MGLLLAGHHADFTAATKLWVTPVAGFVTSGTFNEFSAFKCRMRVAAEFVKIGKLGANVVILC